MLVDPTTRSNNITKAGIVSVATMKISNMARKAITIVNKSENYETVADGVVFLV